MTHFDQTQSWVFFFFIYSVWDWAWSKPGHELFWSYNCSLVIVLCRDLDSVLICRGLALDSVLIHSGLKHNVSLVIAVFTKTLVFSIFISDIFIYWLVNFINLHNKQSNSVPCLFTNLTNFVSLIQVIIQLKFVRVTTFTSWVNLLVTVLLL